MCARVCVQLCHSPPRVTGSQRDQCWVNGLKCSGFSGTDFRGGEVGRLRKYQHRRERLQKRQVALALPTGDQDHRLFFFSASGSQVEPPDAAFRPGSNQTFGLHQLKR